MIFCICLFYSFLGRITSAFVVEPRGHSSMCLDMAAVGIFYGTSTGSTSEVAQKIYEAFGPTVAAEPVDVDTLETEGSSLIKAFGQHDALIVGTPTWNTGADTQRSGTGWDDLYYGVALRQKDLEGKLVAVFGLGNQVDYPDNFADATGELFDAFESIGCRMMGFWSQEGYEHQESKSIRNGNFCGLILDVANQEEMTDDRVKEWVAQLIREGFVGANLSAETSGAIESNPAPREEAQQAFQTDLETLSDMLDKSIMTHSTGGFIPFHNKNKGTTMWVSADGQSSFVTATAGTSPSEAITHFSP